MSETKFTKGPWIVRESMTQIGKCYRVGTDAVIECGHGAALLYDDNSSLNPHGEGVQNANAKLISAAPELYEALASLKALLSGEFCFARTDGDPMGIGDQMRLGKAMYAGEQALAKATH